MSFFGSYTFRGAGIGGAKGAIAPLAFWKIGGFIEKFFIFIDKSVLNCTIAPLAPSSFRRPRLASADSYRIFAKTFLFGDKTWL